MSRYCFVFMQLFYDSRDKLIVYERNCKVLVLKLIIPYLEFLSKRKTRITAGLSFSYH